MLVRRERYLSRLKTMVGTPDIKVITGVRRSGKSVLMKMLCDELFAEDPTSNNVYIDLLDLDNEPLLEYHRLHEYIRGRHVGGTQNRLFVDEVQLCSGFEKAVNSLHARGEWDIYLTGSNAFLLSSDLATLFTGRQREVHVLPFSFEEYCQFFNVESAVDDAFDGYVRRGGLSGSYAYKTDEEAYGYIRDICRTILTRDLVQKFSVADAQVLERLSEFMMDNIGNLNSPNNIAESLKAGKTPTNHVTIGKYMSFMRDAFLFYEARRYDIRGKKYLQTQAKHYACDSGMRYALLGTRNMDWGRMYENLVYLELKRRGWETYVGKLYQKEVDFVARRGSDQVYIQVSDDVGSEKTLEREMAPLLSIKDGYPKIILAHTRHEPYSIEGVKILDIPHWLLGLQSL